MLASADLEGEVRQLLTEAKSWCRKKGGALPLQVRHVCVWGVGVGGTNGCLLAGRCYPHWFMMDWVDRKGRLKGGHMSTAGRDVGLC
jgi:hypothetical protein